MANRREKSGRSDRFHFLVLRNYWRLWLQPWNWKMLLGRKAMTNLDSILKSRDIPFPAKVCIVKAMVFPTVMYGCESWTIKMAKCWRIDAFKLWCWRRPLRVPCTGSKEIKPVSPKGNQSWIFIGRTEAEAEAEAEAPILCHLIWRIY